MWLSKLKELILCLRAGRVTLPYPLVRSTPGAGFRGRPVLDGQKCIGCGACAQVCPPRLITMIDDQDTRTIEVDYARCTYCARCEEVCPEGSIKLNSEFELATTDKNDLKLTAVLTMAKCTQCGKPFMTHRMLDKLVNDFSPAWLQTKEEAPDWFSTCQACRKKQESSSLKGGAEVV